MAAPRQEAGGAAPEGAPIRVAVIEDDRRVRESLGDILSGSRECQFAGAFSSGEQALEQLADVDPRVIIVDVNLPGISGVEVIRRIAAMRRPWQTLVLSVSFATVRTHLEHVYKKLHVRTQAEAVARWLGGREPPRSP